MRYPGLKGGRDGARPSNDNAASALLFHPIECFLKKLEIARLAELLTRRSHV